MTKNWSMNIFISFKVFSGYFSRKINYKISTGMQIFRSIISFVPAWNIFSGEKKKITNLDVNANLRSSVRSTNERNRKKRSCLIDRAISVCIIEGVRERAVRGDIISRHDCSSRVFLYFIFYIFFFCLMPAIVSLPFRTLRGS